MNAREDQAVKLLDAKSVRKTKTRLEVLKVLLEKDYAQSHGDVEDRLSGAFDRVTVYRTLNSFEEKGVTHRVMGEDGVARYALCVNDCTEHHHHDHHLHFHCTNCKNIYCLDDYLPSSPKMPEGFQLEDMQVLVRGVCKNCSSH